MEKVSESVFVGMCHIVGTPPKIAIIRASWNMAEVVNKRVTNNDDLSMMVSGSNREGFRLKGSDLDHMYWPNNHRVIMDVSQSKYYNTSYTSLILSDSSESPPGFTLLQLLTQRKQATVYVQSALVRMNNNFYISSSKYRQKTCLLSYPNSNVHGPCSSVVVGGVEYDHAHCFVCDFWPAHAASWKDRCHSWPDQQVVDDILRSGCHFVAIGHPLGLHENKEWRISFSQAEHKCVYALNHYQFLMYGLLKLFLKEVINQQSEETSKLLCSYHIKTAVFWAIQQNTLPQLCPQNLLACFWISFKLLLKWVFKGICPNFFIPQNNLFLAKVNGSMQINLFLQLHELYKKGLACLLQSSSIRSYIIDVLYNPRLSICTDENVLVSMCEVENDLDLAQGFYSTLFLRDPRDYIKAIKIIEHLVDSSLTHYEGVYLQKLTVFTIQCTAFLLQNVSANIGVNKQLYIFDKISCQMLKLAVRFGCISDLVYIAMYYYKTFRYRKAASVINMTKVKLAKPYLMYRRHVDRESYSKAVGGQPWSTKMRKALAMDVILHNKIGHISELVPEQQSSLQNGFGALYIPVFLMLHFLEFLCYRHIDRIFSQAALDELLVLVHHDQGLYVSVTVKDISWEILGICQQITGNPRAALYSYQQSLIPFPGNKIQTATQIRIRELVKGPIHASK